MNLNGDIGSDENNSKEKIMVLLACNADWNDKVLTLVNGKSEKWIILAICTDFIPSSLHFNSIFIKPNIYIVIIQFILTCPISCTMIYSDEINQIKSTKGHMCQMQTLGQMMDDDFHMS
jgi:hypothetical protein